jgi:Rab GDP dissociation inhibitor
VCQKGYYLAIISTVVETDKPLDELKPAFQIIGDVLETFITVSDEWEPVEEKFEDNVIITKSFSSVSHFEPDTVNVLNLYEKMTGNSLDLDNLEDNKTTEDNKITEVNKTLRDSTNSVETAGK